MYGLETHLFELSPFPQAHLFGISLFPQAHLFGLETHLIGPFIGFLFALQLSDLCQRKHAVVDAPSV